jgi:hypothetical protein
VDLYFNPPDIHGCIAVITVTDSATLFTWVSSLRTKRADEIFKIIEEILAREGICPMVRIDNGSEFKCMLLDTYSEEYGCSHIKRITAGKSRSNVRFRTVDPQQQSTRTLLIFVFMQGGAEVQNRMMRDKHVAYISHDRRRMMMWSSSLQLCCADKNNQISATRKISPFEAKFGVKNKSRFSIHNFLGQAAQHTSRSHDRVLEKIYTVRSLFSCLVTQFHELCFNVHYFISHQAKEKRINAMVRENTKLMGKTVFDIGDLVYAMVPPKEVKGTT